MHKINWLASYPKSGNTWMRIFLSNYRNNRHEPLDINQAIGTPNAASRFLIERSTGLDSSLLRYREVPSIRRQVYSFISAETDHPVFYKIHDALVASHYEEPIVPPESVHCVLYLVRNPLDLCLSFAAHMNCSVDKAIAYMNMPMYTLAGSSDSIQLPQWLTTWSEHVTGWTAGLTPPTLVVRYEDLLEAPHDTFRQVIETLGWELDEDRLDRAIRFSSFNELKEQEQKRGFKENRAKEGGFFRSGRSGTWRERLTAEQAETVAANHRAVMERFGYVDAAGMPT